MEQLDWFKQEKLTIRTIDAPLREVLFCNVENQFYEQNKNNSIRIFLGKLTGFNVKFTCAPKVLSNLKN